MEKAESPREIALGVIPQVADFWLLAEEPKCREPHEGDFLYPRKLGLEKSLRDRRPIFGKMDTQKPLNVSLYAGRVAPQSVGRRELPHRAERARAGAGEWH